MNAARHFCPAGALLQAVIRDPGSFHLVSLPRSRHGPQGHREICIKTEHRGAAGVWGDQVWKWYTCPRVPLAGTQSRVSPNARDTGKCSPAVCPAGQFPPQTPRSISATGLPTPLPSFPPTLAFILLTPNLPRYLPSTTLPLHLDTSQRQRKDQSQTVREAHRPGLFLVSLYNHGTQRKTKVEIVQSVGRVSAVFYQPC